MPDISMCFGKDCAERQGCYRFRALSDGEFQSFGNFEQQRQPGEPCKYFWPTEKAEGPLAENPGEAL